MGLLDSLGDLLGFGGKKTGGVPQYTPYQGAVPQYQQTQLGQQQDSQLGDVLKGRLNAYQQGGSTLDPKYRQAVLGNAQQVAMDQAQTSSQQLGEQFNNWGLLNSSATGYGLGQIQKNAQLAMQNAANYLTQQDLEGLNQLTGQAQGFANSQQGIANNQLQAKQFGYNAGMQENQNQYNSQLANANNQQSQRSNLLEGLFGLGKAYFLKGK